MTAPTDPQHDKTCPLCEYPAPQHFHRDKKREYLRCGHCELIFVISPHLPTADEEKHQYDYHINEPNDPAYRAYLNRLIKPLSQYIPTTAYGLDFGCGPGPTVSAILEEQGHRVDNYDPIYAPSLHWRSQQYDFICCTEVIEHIHSPAQTLDDLWHSLQPNGVFGIMTKRSSTLEHFHQWHYKNDPTHVRFYSDGSFRHIAKRWQATLEIISDDIVILTKPPQPAVRQ